MDYILVSVSVETLDASKFSLDYGKTGRFLRVTWGSGKGSERCESKKWRLERMINYLYTTKSYEPSVRILVLKNFYFSLCGLSWLSSLTSTLNL